MQEHNNIYYNKEKQLKKWYMIEAIIIKVIVAFIISIAIICVLKVSFGKQIDDAIELIDMFSVDTKKQENNVKDINSSIEKNKIIHPEYGTRYGNIKIDSLGINLPLYYGDKLSILRYGVGQSSNGYFPGEGGSIICMGHNTRNFLYNLPQIKINDEIEIETDYGDFRYKVYDTKVVNMYDIDEVKVQDDSEVLMLYTCYPVNGLGHKKNRFVVYANKID